MSVHHFTIVNVQFPGIQDYNQDVVALITRNTEFSYDVPIIIGSGVLRHAINVLRESEIDQLATPWAMARTAVLLTNQQATIEDQKPTGAMGRLTKDEDLEPLTTKTVRCHCRELRLTERANISVSPPKGRQPISGLKVIPTYTDIQAGQSTVEVVVQNLTCRPLRLCRSTKLVYVELANQIPEAFYRDSEGEQPKLLHQHQQTLLKQELLSPPTPKADIPPKLTVEE